ncbi:hypothetical protein [Leptolyngbya iicbica]|uniref:Uncharacterized protein n=1 Tax=Lyngbya confervoides BDU141951 TaxID=1574623 RepID=A0A8T6QP46_9CYAN|nr:hypothetical protein [Leptolyngbya sp. LK]
MPCSLSVDERGICDDLDTLITMAPALSAEVNGVAIAAHIAHKVCCPWARAWLP